MNKKSRKTHMKILEALNEHIKKSGKNRFFKSDFREVRVRPDTAGEWFRIIHYCQTELPRIKIIEMGRNVIIEILGEEGEE